MGFPGGSDGKELACSVGDLGSIPWRRDRLPLQYSGHVSMSFALGGGFFTTRDPWEFLAKTRKQPKCPLTDEWTKNMWCTMVYCSAIEKRKAKPFATTWMGLETIVLNDTERGQSETDKGHRMSLIQGI